MRDSCLSQEWMQGKSKTYTPKPHQNETKQAQETTHYSYQAMSTHLIFYQHQGD